VVLAAGAVASDALTEALKLHVKATLAPYYKYPLGGIVAELPKTATEKIQRFKSCEALIFHNYDVRSPSSRVCSRR
jgi:acyl-coenzyme A synthetase/AMP-(fatty) acid ligase